MIVFQALVYDLSGQTDSLYFGKKAMHVGHPDEFSFIMYLWVRYDGKILQRISWMIIWVAQDKVIQGKPVRQLFQVS